nr:auxilin-like protein [Tanacetum cinerariifolium]
MVKDVLFDVCRRAGISGKKEAPVNFLTDPLDGRSTLRPADVLIFGWVERKHACVNLTRISPLVDLSSRGFTVRQAALKAVLCKVTKYKKACIKNQHVFVPFAFDTFGFLAPEAMELLNRVQQVMHSNIRSSKRNIRVPAKFDGSIVNLVGKKAGNMCRNDVDVDNGDKEDKVCGDDLVESEVCIREQCDGDSLSNQMNDNTVVVFDEVLVAKGSKRWETTVRWYSVGYRMSVNEIRYNLRKMWSSN